MTVDYNFYKSNYGGTVIPSAAWPRIAVKTKARLDKYTFGRIGEDMTNLQGCALCDMAEVVYREDIRGNVTSENNDGYAVSYDTSKGLDEMLYAVASAYLLHTGIMDLAVSEDDH